MTDATPIAVNRTLPRRQPNAAYRQREYLTESEVERLIEAARKRGRNGQRDSAAILLAYRHGLRAAELCSLRWAQVDLRHGRLHVNRAKGGIESVHPLHGPESQSAATIAGQEPLRIHHRGRHASDHCLVPANGFNEQGALQSFPSRSIRTCFAIQLDTSSRTMATIQDRWRTISGIVICKVPQGIPR
jgi:integrase